MMDIRAVNALSCEEFVEMFGNVVEKCPLIAAAIWTHRPFTDIMDIQNHISEFINSLPETGKEGILRCHPDLAGRDLHTGTLTQESQSEQKAAGLTDLRPAEISHMHRLNSEYKERFGFPYIVCARMNNKSDIMKQLADRLRNELDVERARAIEEVKKICGLRLQDVVLPGSPNKL